MMSRFITIAIIATLCVGAYASLPQAVPLPCTEANALAGVTLADGSSVWACGGDHWGSMMRREVGGVDTMIATLSDSRNVGQPWTQVMLDGAVCPVVYWHHGEDCFEGIAKNVMTQLIPHANTSVAEFNTIFSEHSKVNFPGQYGVCYYGYGYHNLVTSGLTQSAATNVKLIRDGLVDKCYIVSYDTRTVMVALWSGIAAIVIGAVTLILGCVAVPSNILTCGTCVGGIYSKVS